MRQPRQFTIHIFSSKRINGASSADYWVSLPQLDALVNGGDRPDHYELYLDKIVGTVVGANNSPENVTNGNGFIQLALDLPAPYKISNATNPNVMFIVPITGSAMTNQAAEGRSNASSPVVLAASGMNSQLHVQLFDQAGAALDVTGHEHVIVLSLVEKRD